MCLNGVVVDSTGIAKQNIPSLLGFYSNHGLSSGKQSFKHTDSEYFLYWYPPSNTWQVSSIVKSNSIIHANKVIMHNDFKMHE